MKTLSIALLALVAQLAVAQDDCPEIPENDVEIGEPVPMNPDDIPEGCSAYEILVGKLYPLPIVSLLFSILMPNAVRS